MEAKGSLRETCHYPPETGPMKNMGGNEGGKRGWERLREGEERVIGREKRVNR